MVLAVVDAKIAGEDYNVRDGKPSIGRASSRLSTST